LINRLPDSFWPSLTISGSEFDDWKAAISMKKIIVTMLLGVVLLTSCSSTSNGIFGSIGNKTPREKYEDKLDDRDLDKTPAGRQWLAAAETALSNPVTVQLPYKQTGRFPADKPRALGLQFSASRGERLSFQLPKNNNRPNLYAEVFKVNGTATELVHAADTAVTEFSYDIQEGGSYILRLQPELAHAGAYQLSIAVGPSLGFPVSGSKAYVGSVWGDVRDGGKRSHEGIDIFAAKRTPAVAAADGYITGVREGGIGGKVVWLRPTGQNYTLYYAHLDEQLVQEGQLVKKGETIGLVGNTGNARTTPAHLHFGIYGYGGAVNPLPFVNRQVKTASTVPDKKLAEPIRLTRSLASGSATVKANTLLVPLGVNAKGFIAELPDGKMVQAPFTLVQAATKPIKKAKAGPNTALYQTPGQVVQGTIKPGSTMSVMGYYNGFAYVRAGEKEGWILETELKG
jgi:peptidoglycan LD-endopeptidase LytH